VRWENKNTWRWPVLLVISMPKIFLNGQFYFNLSSKTWSHVFFGTQCTTMCVCVCVWLSLGYPERGKTDAQRHDVRQHVIGVSNERQRVGDVTKDDFAEKERESQTQHRHHSTCLRLVPTQAMHSAELWPPTFILGLSNSNRNTSRQFTEFVRAVIYSIRKNTPLYEH